MYICNVIPYYTDTVQALCSKMCKKLISLYIGWLEKERLHANLGGKKKKITTTDIVDN
jgi:hypothetical protein